MKKKFMVKFYLLFFRIPESLDKKIITLLGDINEWDKLWMRLNKL